ncbi:MAG: hypothetical protein ACM3JQ_04880 [Candidatus Eiseniibacteriota bacterium]
MNIATGIGQPAIISATLIGDSDMLSDGFIYFTRAIKILAELILDNERLCILEDCE